MVGPARYFPGGKGISCGDKIAEYPVGAASHTTEVWFKAEKPNGTQPWIMFPGTPKAHIMFTPSM